MGYKHHGASHRNGHSLPHDKTTCISVKKEDYEQIRNIAEKNNMKIIHVVDLITKFYINNFVIVEQLSLTSGKDDKKT